MKAHNINKLDNFICGWYHDDISICDKLIEHHRNSLTCPGEVGIPKNYDSFGGINSTVAKHIKDSEDCVLDNYDAAIEYFDWLGDAMMLYKEKYPMCNNFGPFAPVQPSIIQYYRPGAAFFLWHTERINATIPNASRHLVFMTYLNDVTDGGETEWLHQKIKIKPEKGLTVIWPADWTFTHRGCVSMTQEKYIVTGWVNYIIV